jgi:hypothetical protein
MSEVPLNKGGGMAHPDAEEEGGVRLRIACGVRIRVWASFVSPRTPTNVAPK